MRMIRYSRVMSKLFLNLFFITEALLGASVIWACALTTDAHCTQLFDVYNLYLKKNV